MDRVISTGPGKTCQSFLSASGPKASNGSTAPVTGTAQPTSRAMPTPAAWSATPRTSRRCLPNLSPFATTLTRLFPASRARLATGRGRRTFALESTHPSAHRPASSSSQFTGIVSPATLSRDRQVDACALCHNGINGVESKPAFSFVPGDNLAEFIAASSAGAHDQLDVHGNQVGLLKQSRCFRASPNMSCATCHDVHAPELPAASYSSRCLGAIRGKAVVFPRDCVRA